MTKNQMLRLSGACLLILGSACGGSGSSGGGTPSGTGGSSSAGTGGRSGAGTGGTTTGGGSGGAGVTGSGGTTTTVGTGGTIGTTGSGGAPGADAGASGGGTATGGSVGASGGTSGTGAAGGTTTGATGGVTAGGRVSTDPNLKIAFAADTDVGATWKQVGALIKAEGAAAVVVAGDMAYDASLPATWWAATDAALGPTFPVFIAKGNHDDATKWPGLISVSDQRLAGWGAVKQPSGINDATFLETFKGLAILAIADGTIPDGPMYAAYIKSKFAADNHIWRICTWHKDQQAMQAGGKPDEVGWEPYDACRSAGAIIQTGHEHSYARTKTLTGFMTQTIDSTCSAPDALCVGPGRSFAQTVGTGGRDSPLRVQTQCMPVWMSPTANNGKCPYWSVIYTASQNGVAGAQFITFNVGGNPKKATGYFKTITGQTIDTFTITAD